MSSSPLRTLLAGTGLAALALGSGAVLGPAAHAEDAAAQPTPERSFHRLATLPAYVHNEDPSQEAVSEISTVTPDGLTFISTDAAGEQLTFVDISDPHNPTSTGTFALPGEPTSVYATGSVILAVVNTSQSYTDPSGVLLVVDAESRQEITRVDLGGQPDSIDVNPEGTQAAIAIENERDEDLGDGGLPQQPSGYLVTIDLTDDAFTPTRHDLEEMSQVPGVIEPSDLEPEYVAYSPDGSRIALTLQENNAVAIIEAATGEVTGFSVGTNSVSDIDTVGDGDIRLDGSISDLPREPDAIGWTDNDHVAMANEGDWKGGTRGWSIFDAATGELAWDSGNSFEHLGVAHGHWPEHRAEKKGVEPEGLTVATYGDTRYAFVGSERGNYVAVYDVTEPTEPVFTQLLPSTNGPEGLLAVPERDLFIISSETDDAEAGVRATVQVFGWDDGPADSPTIRSAHVADAHGTGDGDLPIGWFALGALSAKPGDCHTLYTAADSALSPSRIFTVDVSTHPAVIDSAIGVTHADGTPASLDIEGIHALADGGFWLAVEGATGAQNKLVRTDDAGRIIEEVTLPPQIAEGLGSQGFEGVTVVPGSDLVVANLQREVAGEDFVRIGLYDPHTAEWAWLGYELETTDVAGDWIGLSEITALDSDSFAVIERDKLNGPDAAIKRVYSFDVPAETLSAGPDEVTMVDKHLALDVLPHLQDFNGWTQEKLEGLTIGADGQVYAVTDNDGLDDATGETHFLRLGEAAEIFPDADLAAADCEAPTETDRVRDRGTDTDSDATTDRDEPAATAGDDSAVADSGDRAATEGDVSAVTDGDVSAPADGDQSSTARDEQAAEDTTTDSDAGRDAPGLADTGAPTGVIGLLVGIAALIGGGLLWWRRRS